MCVCVTPDLLCCCRRERSERRKLQRAVKREERGAARELRRDAGVRRICGVFILMVLLTVPRGAG